MDEGSNHPACASCKYQRKKCNITCVLARHFPSSRMEEFVRVHKVFGVSNVTKMIKDLDFTQQDVSVASLKWEASMWEENPVDGPFGQYKRLEEQLRLLEQQGNIQQVVPLMVDPPELAPAPTAEVELVPWVGENNVINGRDGDGLLVRFDEDTIKNYMQGNGAIELEPSVNNFTSTLQGQYIEEQGIDGISSSYSKNPIPIPQGQKRVNHQAMREINGRDGLMAASYYPLAQGISDGAMYNTYGQERGSHGREFRAVYERPNGEGQRRGSQERDGVLTDPCTKSVRIRRDIGNYATAVPSLVQRRGWVSQKLDDDNISALYQHCMMNNPQNNHNNPDQ